MQHDELISRKLLSEKFTFSVNFYIIQNKSSMSIIH